MVPANEYVVVENSVFEIDRLDQRAFYELSHEFIALFRWGHFALVFGLTEIVRLPEVFTSHSFKEVNDMVIFQI